jgi:hypothetical protein
MIFWYTVKLKHGACPKIILGLCLMAIINESQELDMWHLVHRQTLTHHHIMQRECCSYVNS